MRYLVKPIPFALSLVLAVGLSGCGDKQVTKKDKTPAQSPPETPAETPYDPHAGDDHHDEVSIGTVPVGSDQVTLAQGHGHLVAGEESHLVVKLPYNDKGSTIVRAWVGTSDRTKSYVGKGDYAASHDDYDIHAMVPSPMPEGVMWWVEVQKPDGTKAVGSANPILK